MSAILDRRRWPAIPAALLVVALFVLAVSGFRGFQPSTGAGASPTRPVVAVASEVPQPTGAPAVTEPPLTLPPTGSAPPATAAPTAPASSPAPTKTPKPTFRTYTVKGGDTLSAIAGKYHTTVSAISRLNHITDPSKLRVGQVLLIPN